MVGTDGYQHANFLDPFNKSHNVELLETRGQVCGSREEVKIAKLCGQPGLTYMHTCVWDIHAQLSFIEM